ncbi:MAG TPA: beta-galactosidase [Chloroflexi bacterium]|nr:beta-galactosidase [Chloroflexota bacterium]
MTDSRREDGFALGVCYYPEQWPREQWAEDARRMRELGLRYVRVAEFAWALIEPRQQEWDWGWLDEAIDTLSEAGLLVVMSTPTAAPPAWLVQQHPEILPAGSDGRIRGFGARRHYDTASRVFREHSRRITRAVARRYGQHPSVVGWQLDNEMADHDTGLSYSDASLAGFRRWLSERYETLPILNEAWGTVFWSQGYTDWEQIQLPNVGVDEPNPSLALDFQRYRSDTIVEFLAEQAAIVRELSPGRWITHNVMRLTPDFDHYRASECLDFVSWDSYPTGAVAYSDLDLADRLRFARTGHPDLTGFNHDLYRGLKDGRSFWVMEQQAGQINWAPSNPLPPAGAVALWTAHAWAHGASVVSYFRWRAGLFGQEQMHSGLLRHDGTLDRGGAEVAEMSLPGLPVSEHRAPVVLLHDYESLWAFDRQRHTAGASYWGQMLLFYRALRSLGVDVDIRHVDADLAGYQLIVVPALVLCDTGRAQRLARWAGDARLVFGPRAGSRDESGRAWPDGQPGQLAGLLGCRVLNIDGLPPGMAVHVAGHETTIWAESYRLAGGEAVARYDDGPLTGDAAVVRNGPVATIGAWSATLIRSLLRDELAGLDIATRDLPDGVRVTRRAGRAMLTNFTEAPVALDDGTTLAPVSYRID